MTRSELFIFTVLTLLDRLGTINRSARTTSKQSHQFQTYQYVLSKSGIAIYMGEVIMDIRYAAACQAIWKTERCE
jgi:hypothetical protein